MSVFQRQAHLTAGTVIDAENLPHVTVCRTAGVFLSQLRDGFRVCPCQLLHQALPAVLALVYRDEAGHTPDHTGKVGVYIALPRLVDDAKHLDVALTAILLVQLVCRFDAVDFSGCPDAVITGIHRGLQSGLVFFGQVPFMTLYALKKTWWRIAGRLDFLFRRGLSDRCLYWRFRLFCLQRRVVFRCRRLFLLRCRLWLRWWLARLQTFEDRIITVTLFLLEFLKNCRAFFLWN